MKVKFRRQAIEDIDAIWLYTKEQWSRDQANRYYNLIYEEAEHLSAFPLCGKDCSELGKGYRYHKVMSHFIFYRITGTESLEVIRVLHENMDFLEQFKLSK
jgi:toxin ParE1/3/4